MSPGPFHFHSVSLPTGCAAALPKAVHPRGRLQAPPKQQVPTPQPIRLPLTVLWVLMHMQTLRPLALSHRAPELIEVDSDISAKRVR